MSYSQETAQLIAERVRESGEELPVKPYEARRIIKEQHVINSAIAGNLFQLLTSGSSSMGVQRQIAAARGLDYTEIRRKLANRIAS